LERYKLTFAYEGTNYFGSQRQETTPTVQRALENALSCIGWQGDSILLAGRTDTGVHASGQVAAFDFEWQHDPEELLRAINAKLPTDIAVTQISIVPREFHPRFDASSRVYSYRIYCQPIRDPFRERLAWRQWPPLNGRLLDQAAEVLIGTHDFAAFGTPPRKEQSTIRNLYLANWSLEGDEWKFTIQANAFLYHMVRRLVFFQVAIAQGRLPLSLLGKLLKVPKQKAISGLAPSNGLTLIKVTYPE
jgi:tRNA pseudouridine38-40 synthase